jgi:hypothetical protein
MALRQKILEAPTPDDADACAARLQALSLFDITVLLSSPIVEAVQEPAPENVPMFSPGAKAPEEDGKPVTTKSLVRWAQSLRFVAEHDARPQEWAAWEAAAAKLLGTLGAPTED